MLEKQVQIITSTRDQNKEAAFRVRNVQRQAHFDKNYEKSK